MEAVTPDPKRSIASRLPMILRFGPFEVNLPAQELRKAGAPVKLQGQPFRILAMLLDHPGEVVTREELRQKLWPTDTFVAFDGSLATAVNKLRSALGDSAENPAYIATVPRRGYRLIAPMELAVEERVATPTGPVLEEKPKLAAAPLTTKQDIVKPDATEDPAPQKQRPHKITVILATAAILGLLLGAIAYWRFHHSGNPETTHVNLVPRRSVAVLGFKNLSGRQDVAWLSTALSDWMTTELSAGDELRTVPAENISRMRAELALTDVEGMNQETLARVGKNLGTDLVLTGSYATLDSKAGDARSGEQIRLDLRLQDAHSGETLVAVSETGSGHNLFDLVSLSGEQLRRKLGMRSVTPQEAAAVSMALPTDPEAARSYAEGLAMLRIFDTLAARDFLEKAVKAGPDFAMAHVALAAALSQLGYEENAKVEAEKAYKLSSGLSRSERLLIEARYHELTRDWDKAIEIYRNLTEAFPDNLEYMLAMANTQNASNKWNDTLVTVDAMRQLPQPLRDDPRIDLMEAEAAYSLGDVNRAQAALARAEEKARAAGASLILARALSGQARGLQDSGRLAEAADLLRKAKQIYAAAHDVQGAADTATFEASALEMQGQYPEALKTYKESLAMYERAGNQHAMADEDTNLGELLLDMGDAASARTNYEKAIAMYREIDDDDGMAWSKIGLGQVSRALGKYAEARRLLGDALDVARRIEDRSAIANAVSELGMVLREEGDLEAGRKSVSDGLAIFTEIGDKPNTAGCEVYLAQIMADQGNLAEAEMHARKAVDQFGRDNNRMGAPANAVLSRILRAQGRLQDARKAIELAQTIVKGVPDLAAELSVTIQDAYLADDAAQGKKQLEEAVTTAHKAGFLNYEFEARLALAEMELRSGDKSRARASLQILEKDAKSHDLGSIVLKTKADLAN